MDLAWSWIGCVPYGEALQLQREHREQVINGEQPEIVWLLEHDPVVTTGRRPVPGLPSKDALADQNVELYQTERGGLATYHGPGQLVAYPIVNCWDRGMGAKGAVHAMEQAVIDWLLTLDISADRRPGFPGVWIGHAKICAIGMHFKKGVSIHGIAINLTDGLTGFDLITPCGLTDCTITSVSREAGIQMTAAEAAPLLAPHILHNLLNPSCTVSTRSHHAG